MTDPVTLHQTDSPPARPRIVFAGTPDFSVACLKELLNQEVDVVAVYTQPDRAAGRGKKLLPGPVKQCAVDAGVPVYQPRSFRDSGAVETLAGLRPDLMIVVAYGLILPQQVLDIPRLGCINIHASLLPRWRGAAPIQRAIEAGDEQSGVCIMQMEKGLDTGPVLACRPCLIDTDTTGGQLHDQLALLGAELLHAHLDEILKQRLEPAPQAREGVTYAHKLGKEETRIDWRQSALQIANKIRAFNPWPVMTAKFGDQLIRIHFADADSAANIAGGDPGRILSATPEGICIATGAGCLNVTRLQKPGGKVLSARDFLNGFALAPGQYFE